MEIAKFGYIESKNKPGLFYKIKDNTIRFFIDLRSQYYLNPSFYYQWIAKELPIESKRMYSGEILNEFFSFCKENHISLNFRQLSNCLNCNRYIVEEFSYDSCCSEECSAIEKKKEEEYHVKSLMRDFENWRGLKCGICDHLPEFSIERSEGEGYFFDYKSPNRAEHHTDYINDKRISICLSCHAKITFHQDKYPELKQYEPIGKREKPEPKYKFPPCSNGCGGNVRVLASDNAEKPICYKCKKNIARQQSSSRKRISFSSYRKQRNRPSSCIYNEVTS